jgi:hypothetical protein
MTDALFDGYEPEIIPGIDPDLSAGQRLTLRQTGDIRAGRHPLTHGPLHDQGDRSASRDNGNRRPLTCGTCIYRELFKWHDYTYPKCIAHDRVFLKHSTATDVRAWWPACPSYLPTAQGDKA